MGRHYPQKWLSFRSAPTPAFIERYPGLRVKLDVNNRALDQLGNENELALIIGSPPPHTGAIAEITRFEVRLIGSKKYLDEHGRPACPAELVDHHLLGASDRDGKLSWQLRQGDSSVEVEAFPRVSLLDPDTRASMVKLHMGISWLPAFLCQPELGVGDLEVVLPAWDPQSVRLHALVPTAQMNSAKAKAMVDFLSAAIDPQVGRFEGQRAVVPKWGIRRRAKPVTSA